jgi:hypothetical protein
VGWDGQSPEPTVVALLAAVTQEFDLAPWPNVAPRLAELQTRYLPAGSLRQQRS